MISLEKCIKLAPKLDKLSEAEIIEVREELYQLADIALENWAKENMDSKDLEWLLPKNDESLT